MFTVEDQSKRRIGDRSAAVALVRILGEDCSAKVTGLRKHMTLKAYDAQTFSVLTPAERRWIVDSGVQEKFATLPSLRYQEWLRKSGVHRY